MNNIIVIVGPTGVGKTKLGIELAKKLNGEIINGDSVSVYKKLDIGSAKPSVEERKEITHHLVDIREVTEEYSVFDYQKDCRKAIDEILSKNKTPIIVGGTGLYIKAALYDYNFTNNTKFNDYSELTNLQIQLKIKEYNSDIDIHINNRKRLVRMLNKLENNEPIINNKDKLLYPIKIIGLTTSRDVLYNRINERVDIMIANGLIDEINLLKDNYKDSRVLNTAIGYKEFSNFFSNERTLEEVIENIKKNSRHYAKRQYTFFNHQMDVRWFDTDFNNFDNTIDTVMKYLKK